MRGVGRRVDDDRRYEMLTMACKMASGPDGWLIPSPREMVAGDHNELALMIYTYLKPSTRGRVTLFKVMGSNIAAEFRSQTLDHVVILGRDKRSYEIVGNSVDKEMPSRKDSLFLLKPLQGNCSPIIPSPLRKAIRENDMFSIKKFCINTTTDSANDQMERLLSKYFQI